MSKSISKLSLIWGIIAGLIVIFGSVLMYISATAYRGNIEKSAAQFSTEELLEMELLAGQISTMALAHILLTVIILFFFLFLIIAARNQHNSRIRFLSMSIAVMAIIQIVLLIIISGISFLLLFSLPILFYGLYLFTASSASRF